MVDSGDSWMRQYNEAVKLADDIGNMMSERSLLLVSSPESQRHTSTMRRKMTMLGTKLDSLESRLPKLPGQQSLLIPASCTCALLNAAVCMVRLKKTGAAKDNKNRGDLVVDLRSTLKQMASTLNMPNLGNRDLLLEPDSPESKPSDAMSRAAGLSNAEVVGLQGQIIKEQDQDFEKLEETVMKTRHIALAINEELDLHTKLIFDLDEGVEVTGSRLQQVKSKLAILNKRTKGGCSCVSLLLSVIGIVLLIVVAYMLIRFL